MHRAYTGMAAGVGWEIGLKAGLGVVNSRGAGILGLYWVEDFHGLFDCAKSIL
ncbi:hypothetical protein [Sulfitobacter donghicola]|nr:hypothetical protein [Sulfitobacter donghicola]